MKSFLRPLLAASAACALAAPSFAGDALGLQLWSLRNGFKADVPGTLAQARGLGFTLVETAGTYGLSAEDFGRQLQADGFRVESAHFPYERLEHDLPGVIADAKALGAKFVVIAWIPHEGDFDAAAAAVAAANLDQWGAALRAAGLRLGLHTHGYEFRPMKDPATGRTETPFDLIVRSTRPENVCFEMDVFWVTRAGADPVKLLKRYPGRWKLMHMKDIRKGAPVGLSTGSAPATDDVPVGAGQVDWPAVLRAARRAGVRYYFIEDESLTPLRNIPLSLAYLRRQGL